MDELHYTLLSDGPSDQVLVPILKWLLQQHVPNLPIHSRWADLRRLDHPPKELRERICKSIEFFPCDLLFVHRDAETASFEERLNEIKQAVTQTGSVSGGSTVICVVPVRMTEAWLLLDIDAIRQAAGNPNGAVPLQLPRLSEIESLPHPEMVLHEALRTATELGTHRRRRFDVNKAVRRVPEYIEDFAPLRSLSAFAALEEEIERTVESKRWND
jgi:hypothetical protein